MGFAKENHVRLQDTLSECKGLWMVSYNDCEYIRKLYKDYNILGFTRINNFAQRYDGGCEYPEVIITNYNPSERQETINKVLRAINDIKLQGEKISIKKLMELTGLSRSVFSKPHIRDLFEKGDKKTVVNNSAQKKTKDEIIKALRQKMQNLNEKLTFKMKVVFSYG